MGSSCCDTCPSPAKKSSSDQGIKTTPLILLILMVGTTILPALIYASDYLGVFLAKNNVLGQIGFRLGMGAVPKKRVISFYEKHDPTKLDEAPFVLAKEQLRDTYTLWINSYWNVYAPQPAKTAARNIRYNLTFLHKKIHKVFWKKIWPHLEPFLGVPKGAEKQKRKDREEARKRRERTTGSGSSSSSRSKMKYRDDEEE